jgi:hypothetical protein
MTRQTRDSRKLTSAKVRLVLHWNAKYQRFLHRHGSIASLAQRQGVSARAIYRCIQAYRAVPARLRSTGRPRSLSSAQVRAVLTWYDRRLRFLKAHGSVKDLSARLHVSKAVIYACIRRGGPYRRPFGHPKSSLVKANWPLAKRHRVTARRLDRKAIERDTHLRAVLLQGWRGIGTDRSHEPTRPSRGAKCGR